MKTLTFLISCSLMIVGCKSKPNDRTSRISTLNTSDTPAHLNFFDDEGFPIERSDFSFVEAGQCRQYGKRLPNGDRQLRGKFFVYRVTPTGIDHDIYRFDNGNCSGNPIEIEDFKTSEKAITWEKITVDGKKALYSEAANVVDFGKVICRKDPEKRLDEGLIRCTTQVFNIKTKDEAVKEAQKSLR